MQLADATLAAFIGLSGLRIFSYIPQIIRVVRDKNGATAISYCTWSMWTLSNAATAAYAVVNLGETYLAVVSSVYAICCLAVIAITIRKRRTHYGRQRRGESLPRADVDLRRRDLQRSAQRLVADEADRLLSGMRPCIDFEHRLRAQRNMMLRHDLCALLP